MLLVLLVVPALVAAQQDVRRHFNATRRSLRAPVAGLRWGMTALWATTAVWAAVTLGWVIWLGHLPAPLTAVLPRLADTSPMAAALGLFIGGTGLLMLAAYLVASLVFLASRKGREVG